MMTMDAVLYDKSHGGLALKCLLAEKEVKSKVEVLVGLHPAAIRSHFLKTKRV